MPHITIEMSANIAERHDVDALVAAVHAAAIGHGLPPADGLRTRAAIRDHYVVADGDPDHAFAAIMVRVGPGRDVETRRSFLAVVLDAATNQLDSEREAAGIRPLAVAWSAELAEIDPDQRINSNEVRVRMAESNGS